MVELEDIRFERDDKHRLLVHLTLVIEPYEWPTLREVWDEMEDREETEKHGDES